jgi:hypothetical protein
MTNKLKELALAATQGPWIVVGMSYYHYQIHGKGVDGHGSERICMTTNAVANDAPAERREANASYIAAASPDVVLALIEKVDSLTSPLPLSDEQDRALCEANCNAEADAFFAARPALDFPEMRRIFYAGHRRAWISKDSLTKAAHNIGAKE